MNLLKLLDSTWSNKRGVNLRAKRMKDLKEAPFSALIKPWVRLYFPHEAGRVSWVAFGRCTIRFPHLQGPRWRNLEPPPKRWHEMPGRLVTRDPALLGNAKGNFPGTRCKISDIIDKYLLWNNFRKTLHIDRHDPLLVSVASSKLGQFNFTWLLQGELCIHPISSLDCTFCPGLLPSHLLSMISMNFHTLKSLRDFQRATCAKSPPSTSCHVVSSLRSAFCSLSQPTAALPTFGVTICGALLVSWQGNVGYVRHLRSGWASCNSSPDCQNFLSCNGAFMKVSPWMTTGFKQKSLSTIPLRKHPKAMLF